MAKVYILVATASTLLLIGAAQVARADSPRPQITPVATDNLAGVTLDASHWGPQPTHHVLEWQNRGHWSLQLDLSQPVGRDMELRDIQAGAYYRITPSLRVGGAVSLGDTPATPDRYNLPQTQAPRVRLETNFKF
jgi:hypothetical protein